MRSLAYGIMLAVLAAVPAWSDPSQLTKDAAAALDRAAKSLVAAETARNRIAALTETIRAYETGLSAMRASLRETVTRRKALEDRLSKRDAELADHLVLLQRVSRAGQVQGLVHSGSALDGVRAGLLTSAMIPALKERSAILAQDFQDLEALRVLQQSGIETLTEGYKQIRSARERLSAAISDRTDLPESVATDEATLQALINSTETLAAFADSLTTRGDDQPLLEEPWQFPVVGQINRGFDEPDAAGARQPGLTIATEPAALVTSPAGATARFAGEMPGHGRVVILEAAPGNLVILTGLGTTFVKRGQIVSKGEPIALMAGEAGHAQENLNDYSLGGGQSRAETLYMEIRQGQSPVDPATFLRLSME